MTDRREEVIAVCFSAEASFAVGGALIPAGIYCLWSAVIKKPTYLGLAAAPLFFGLQQISEGFVWLALNRQADTRPSSLVFLFFALAFWPFWFPVLSTLMEPQPKRKIIFAALSVLATGWFWILYYPILMGEVALTTQPEHHSIAYHYPDLPVYLYIDRLPLRILYFLSVALPPLVGSETWGRLPGLVLGASALFAAIVYHYAFVSVWCFFAAVLASYLCYVFYQLPAPKELSSTASLQPIP